MAAFDAGEDAATSAALERGSIIVRLNAPTMEEIPNQPQREGGFVYNCLPGLPDILRPKLFPLSRSAYRNPFEPRRRETREGRREEDFFCEADRAGQARFSLQTQS